MDKVNKEQLLREIATLYKGITVAKFAEKFGRMTAEMIARRLRIAKAIYMQVGVMV